MAQLDVTVRGYQGPMEFPAASAWVAGLFAPELKATALVTSLEQETVDVTELGQADRRAMPTGRASVHAVVTFGTSVL